MSVRPSPPESPAAVTPPAQTVVIPSLSADPIGVLRTRRLDLPVKGMRRDALRNTFDDPRGSARRHEAIDLLAPHRTPVVAVEDGTIARLFLSDAGGITVYQFDPTSTYVYYYAHLDAYADGLEEGGRVKQWWQGTPIDPYKILR